MPLDSDGRVGVRPVIKANRSAPLSRIFFLLYSLAAAVLVAISAFVCDADGEDRY